MNALTFKSDSQGSAAGTSTLKATLLNYNCSQTNQRNGCGIVSATTTESLFISTS